MKDYKRTLTACYLGFITQAIVANLVPLLFVIFHSDYGISLAKIALIPTVFFFTQLLVDLFCARFVDIIGYRRSVVASEVLAALGLILLAVLPELLPDAFTGILICVFLYAIGSGLIEVLVSPIVEACPFDNKESVMSLLHSFYCWGCVGVILISTVLLRIFGNENWKWVACIWAVIPIVNIYNFLTCPIEHLTDEGEGYSMGKLFTLPTFWICIVLMICAGSSELAMAQWSSAYVEATLGFTKTVGDIVGPCLFAVTMGLCRVFYGKFGEKINLIGFMIASGVLCVICYILVSFSEKPIIGLIGCIVCGASVGIMWPGTISITSKRIPLGGTAMFALLAMAGDLGGSIGPAIVGVVSQAAGDNLHAGMMVGMIFPMVLIVAIILLSRMRTR